MKNLKVLSFLLFSTIALLAACDKQRAKGQNSNLDSSPSSNSMILEGTINGGGGKGILCNENGNSTLEMLDLYEARSYGLELLENPANDDEALQLVATKLAEQLWNPETFEISLFRDKLVSELKEKWLKKIRYLKGQRELKLINDSHEIILEKNCRPVQVAVYYESAIYVNENLWKKLDYLNRAALWLHEIIYFIERSNGHTNSISTRLLVGQLLSKKGSVPRGQNVPLNRELRRHCNLMEGGLDVGYFYAFESKKDNSDGLELNFNYLKNSSSVMKTTAFFDGFKLSDIDTPLNRVSESPVEVEGLVSQQNIILKFDQKLGMKMILTDKKNKVIAEMDMSCSKPLPPENPPIYGSKALTSPAPPPIPETVDLLSRYVDGGSYGKTATYSFRYMSHDEELTRNNWDLLFEARSDFREDYFRVNTVTDDDSFIFPLESGKNGCVQVDPCEVQKFRLHAKENEGTSHDNRKFDQADVKVGQCYLNLTKDHGGSIAVMFAVKSLVPHQSTVIHQIQVLPDAFELNPKCEKK